MNMMISYQKLVRTFLSAMAAPNAGTVNFTGNITTATCELALQDNAGSGIANVDLGTLSTTSTGGTPVNFKLVPQTPDCLAKTQANINWTSSTLSASGIDNATKKGGTNAYLQVKTTNATQTGDAGILKQGQSSFDYNVTGGVKSFNYTATLMKPAAALTAGPFNASASYMITYR
ncbi:fimbrial protein [Escherichia ruysiae]|uniref:fimbrial protein n=1 Tax=Escherichia ruysiae TaxID=2608867 RepID=UPI001C9B06C1|nr:fimbrial protein [Escherichia ruysiae]MBY7281946.1 fimbrial protein [Escherichia ruysiae]